MAYNEDYSLIEGTAQRYLNTLTENNIPVSRIYLFGSCAKGTQRHDSDIDLAVFWDTDSIDTFESDLCLMKLTRNIDLRIEPHSFCRKDIMDPDPFVGEILATGRRMDHIGGIAEKSADYLAGTRSSAASNSAQDDDRKG